MEPHLTKQIWTNYKSIPVFAKHHLGTSPNSFPLKNGRKINEKKKFLMQAQNYFYLTFLFPFFPPQTNFQICIIVDENKLYNLKIFINNYETMMIVTFKYSQKVNNVLYLLYNCRVDLASKCKDFHHLKSTLTINCVQNTTIG